jgi:hypothetical protein
MMRFTVICAMLLLYVTPIYAAESQEQQTQPANVQEEILQEEPVQKEQAQKEQAQKEQAQEDLTQEDPAQETIAPQSEFLEGTLKTTDKPSYTENEYIDSYERFEQKQDYEITPSSIENSSQLSTPARQLYDTIMSHGETVTITGQGVTYENYQEKTEEFWNEACMFDPIADAALGGLSYRCRIDENSVTYEIDYWGMDKAEFDTRYSQVEAAILKSDQYVDDTMTDKEKVRALHDYLVFYTSYDLTYSRYTAYDALVNGSAVCDGYAKAFNILLAYQNIKSIRVTCDDLNHAWNQVYVDGGWYYVDCTWDDPIKDDTDCKSFIDYEYFLKNEQEFQAEGVYGHHGTYAGNQPSNGTVFLNIPSEGSDNLTYDGDNWYRLTPDRRIVKTDFYGNNEVQVYDTRYQGSCITVYNHMIYYADYNEVYKIAADFSGAEKVITLDEGIYCGYIHADIDGNLYYSYPDNGGMCDEVIPIPGANLSLQGISLDKTNVNLDYQKSIKLSVSYNPSNTTDDKTVTWTSSNPEVASVKDGTVTAGNKRGTAAITAAVGNKSAICNVIVGPNPFSDVTSADWFYEPAMYVYDYGYMTGMGGSSRFAPAENLSRAQFACILHRMEGSPKTEYTDKFPDVTEGEFYTEAVLWANQNGILNGYSNGNFGPADNITREQIAIMMSNYAKYKDYDTSENNDLSGFPDRNSVSSFALSSVKWAVGAGLISGDKGNISPQGNASRAQCAAIIMRFVEHYK